MRGGRQPSNNQFFTCCCLTGLRQLPRSCYFLPMSHQQAPTGPAIRQLRKAAGIKQKELAEFTNISASHLCRIEQGERVATQRVASAIYQYLGVEAA